MAEGLAIYTKTRFVDPPASKEYGDNTGDINPIETFTDSGGDRKAFKLQLETHWGKSLHTTWGAVYGVCTIPRGSRRAKIY